MSDHDTISQVQKELTELLAVGAITPRVFAKAMTYVANNSLEIVETASYSSVGDTVDGIIDVVGSCCVSGACAS